MKKLVVVDTGLGNVRSVVHALEEAGRRGERATEIAVSSDADRVRRADALVVPGQGGFGDCSRALGGGLGDAVRESIGRGAPYLGICLGLQILFATSEEAPGCGGLAIFEGRVARLAPAHGIKIPHVGWNVAAPTRPTWLLESAESFYFVHSYVVSCEPAISCATTEHGARFVSAIEKDNVAAVQFHPEKSQRAGLALLQRFLAR
ncbi:MAG TPA: imidazole glycerol phosphate synthase subunit HisH [Polyangiaceae bacterium]|jgi:glutamine amidotransferase